VTRLNDQFGTEWSDADFVGHITSIMNRMADREDVRQAAAVNTPDNFKLFAAKYILSRWPSVLVGKPAGKFINTGLEWRS
jgi:hypothetical protein